VGTRLLVTESGGILVLTLDSEDGYPRLERKIMGELAEQIERLAATSELSGAVVTGTNRAFATGAEITELWKLTPAEARDFAKLGQSVMRAIAGSPKPIVAAIHGYCIGGGLDLALACVRRIASRDAVFAHPGGSLGITTGWGGTQRLPRLIGRSRAIEMLVTGRRLSAPEAFECGLVHQVASAEEVMTAGVRLATQARAMAR
jgi:enoyl-CoA hydratase